MEKTAVEAAPDDTIDFVVLKEPLGELSDNESIAIAAAQIELGQTQDETMMIHSVSYGVSSSLY